MLPYHKGVWVVSKLLPYFQDLCRTDEKNCQLFHDYTWFCLINRSWILNDKDRSDANLIEAWTATVAARFFLDRDYLRVMYTKEDNHNSEARTRTMFKYASHRGITGTPQFLLNEVFLDNHPTTADEWLALLQKTYDSQKQHSYSPRTEVKGSDEEEFVQ